MLLHTFLHPLVYCTNRVAAEAFSIEAHTAHLYSFWVTSGASQWRLIVCKSFRAHFKWCPPFLGKWFCVKAFAVSNLMYRGNQMLSWGENSHMKVTFLVQQSAHHSKRLTITDNWEWLHTWPLEFSDIRIKSETSDICMKCINVILSSDNIKLLLAVMSMCPPINNTNKFIFPGVQTHTHICWFPVGSTVYSILWTSGSFPSQSWKPVTIRGVNPVLT